MAPALLFILVQLVFISSYTLIEANDINENMSSIRDSRGLYQDPNFRGTDRELTRNATREDCCPKDATCTTPEGTRGRCVDIQSCFYMLDLMKRSKSRVALNYFQQSRCEGPAEYSVCCEVRRRGGDSCTLEAYPPTRSSRCCGLNAKGTFLKELGPSGIVDSIDHPWIGRVNYAKGDEVVGYCNCVLISGQYVLTAGHCVVGPMLEKRTPVSVTLGVADCSRVEDPHCEDGLVTVPIATTTPHKYYDPHIERRNVDIALIRLAKVLEYTAYVRPICLTTADLAAEIKSVCNIGKMNPKLGNPIVVVPTVTEQEPASANYTEDPAAIIYVEYDGQYDLVGIATLNRTIKGAKKIYNTYTQVHLFYDWIHRKIAAEEYLQVH